MTPAKARRSDQSTRSLARISVTLDGAQPCMVTRFSSNPLLTLIARREAGTVAMNLPEGITR